jgi:hypothetical protein
MQSRAPEMKAFLLHRPRIGVRQPLGYAMVGGLLLSQVLTLFTSPVIYLYLDRLSARLNAAPQHMRAQPSGNPAMPGKARFTAVNSDNRPSPRRAT